MSNPLREALKAWVSFCEDPENLGGDHDDNGPGDFTMPCGCRADMIWRSHKGPFSPSPFPPEPFPHAEDCPLMQAHAALDLPVEEERPCGVCYTTNCLHASSGCDFNCDCHAPSDAAESEDDDECPTCGAAWAPEWIGKIKPTNPRETPDV